MCRPLWSLPPARRLLDRLASLLGQDLLRLTTKAGNAELMLNRNVHRVVHAHHLAHWFAFQELREERIGGVLSMSSGTAAALAASQSMSIEDSCAYVMARTAVFEKVCARLNGRYGSAIVIAADFADPAPLIEMVPGLSVAFRVAPWKSVVAGLHDDIAALRKIAKERRSRVQINDIAVEAPYHTRIFRSCRPALRRCVEQLIIRRPRIPLFLGASGQRETDPGRIRRFLINSADSTEAYCSALQAAYDFGLREFLEVGHDPKTERYVVDRIVDSTGALAPDVRCRSVQTAEMAVVP